MNRTDALLGIRDRAEVIYQNRHKIFVDPAMAHHYILSLGFRLNAYLAVKDLPETVYVVKAEYDADINPTEILAIADNEEAAVKLVDEMWALKRRHEAEWTDNGGQSGPNWDYPFPLCDRYVYTPMVVNEGPLNILSGNGSRLITCAADHGSEDEYAPIVDDLDRSLYRLAVRFSQAMLSDGRVLADRVELQDNEGSVIKTLSETKIRQTFLTALRYGRYVIGQSAEALAENAIPCSQLNATIDATVAADGEGRS